jgi:uncharacterized protein YbcC (UPF0753/DUF2309 family)
MGNTRTWTRDFNERKRELETFVKAKAGKSITKRKQARDWAAVRPNSLPPVERPRP